MPIRPENKARYPKNWSEIRTKILKRADNRCEGPVLRLPNVRRCNAPHKAMIYRVHGDWVFATGKEMVFGDSNETIKPTRVILTIAHLDHTPEHNDPDNLRALCQGCHNRHDAKHRAANRKINAQKDPRQ